MKAATLSLALVLSLGLETVAINVAVAEDVKGARGANATPPPITSTVEPLSSQECASLGGTVSNKYYMCKSGSACVVRTSKGAILGVCLKKAVAK
jgi:hypothetical protein